MRRDISSFGRPGHLPFDDRKDEFVKAVEENDFVILYGDTGSGKTLRGPVAFHKAFPGMRIAVTQPRRNAVSSLAKRIAFEQGWRLGDEHIGYYLARQRSPMTKETKIVFQIDQSLVNRILEDDLLSEYDAVFLDEQHLRIVPIDILQGRLSAIMEKRPDFKVVISTATPDIAKLEKFYGQFGSVSTVRVEGRPGNVEIRWAWMKKREHHLDAVKRWMGILIKEGCRGKVAVFLPGVEEINEVIDFVDSFQRPDIDALPCHGKLDDDEQNRIYEPVNGNRLRFIAATEIIETSITIPDLVGGIDTMQVFRRDINWMGVASYVKRNIAKDSAKQRMGRFGRIAGTTGFYMPIIGFESDESAERHWNRLPEHTPPQILATDLGDAVLTVEAMGIEFDKFPWMDRPSQSDYEKTVINLQRLGALDENGRITDEGRIYARMPFSAGLAKAYFKAEEFGVAEAVKIGIAGLQGNDSIFWVPGRRKDVELTPAMEELLPDEAREFMESRTRTIRTKNGKKEVEVRYLPSFSSWNGQKLAKYHREQFAAGTHSDIVAIILAYLQWQENGRSSEWARARMLKPKVLWNMFNGIKDINQALWEAGMNGKNKSDNVKSADPQLVVRALAAGLVNNLAVHKERNNYSGILYDLIVSSSSALNSAKKWPKVVLFSQVTLAKGIGYRGSDLRFAEILSEINPEDIATDNPQLCEYSYGNYEYNPEKDMVESDEHLKYVNTEIRVQKVVRGSDDPQAIKAFADALASGKVEYPGKVDNDALCSEIDALNLRWQGKVGQITSDKLSEVFQARLTEVQTCTLQEAKDKGVNFRINETDAELILGIESLADIRKRTAVERPEMWTINGQEFPLEYKMSSWSFTGVILRLPVHMARTIKLADMPNFGDDCNIRVYLLDKSYSDIYVASEEIGKLADKIESRRIEQCWAEAHSQHETSWTRDPQKVIGWLNKVGSRVEVTRTDNGEGEPIFGYFSLYSDSDSDFQVRLRESREKAEEETKVGLERLLKKSCRDRLTIPKEEPWQKPGYWNWELTDLGRALQSRYEQLVREYAEGLTSDNIKEKIEALKTACEQARLKIGGEHAEAQQLVETTKERVETLIEGVNDSYFVESEIEQAREAIRDAKDYLKSAAYDDAKVACKMAVEAADQLAELCVSRSQMKCEAEDAQDEVADELYNLQYGNDEFAEATDEEQSEAGELSRDISNALYDRHYEVAMEKVAEARELIARVRAEIPARQVARRARFPEAVWEAVGDDEDLVESVVELAKAATGFVGAKKALCIFKQELNAPYGYARRQDGVQNAIYQIAQTDIGDLFLNLHRARDVNRWLAGAVAWLENELAEEERTDEVVDFSPPSADSLAALAAKNW